MEMGTYPLSILPRTLSPLALLFASLVVFLVFFLHRCRRSSIILPYPPGPPGQLLLGNIKEAQSYKSWEKYAEMGKQYDLIHLCITGQHVLIVNSVEAADELLTKRSKLYSDRPQFPMVNMTGWDLAAALIPYGDTWRAHRRVFQQGFNPKAIVNYRPIHTEKLHVFLNKLLSNPDAFLDHTHHFVASIIMKITYHYEVKDTLHCSGEDRLMDATIKAVDAISKAILPGSWLVNSLPVLQYLPKWFPGCGAFNKFAAETRALVDVMANESYDYARKHARNTNCLVTILEELQASPSSYLKTNEDILRGVCAQAFAAGSETTIISLTVFFLAMRQNPTAQTKAQEEILRVVGPHRLPDYDDRPLLPYVEAVFREVMRWMPVLPLGLGHRSIADDVYRGYFIPGGTLVFANIWAMTNDEEKYSEPHKFMPERYMNEDGTINSDDTVLAFGFGRRVCVGQHFASASVWRTIAAILATFTVEKPKDDALKDLKDPREIFSSGAVITADPFKCLIRPRNAEMAEMVRNLDL